MKYLLFSATLLLYGVACAQHDSTWTLDAAVGVTMTTERHFADYLQQYPGAIPEYSGFHTAVLLWRNFLHYGKNHSFFDVGGSLEYLPFIRRVSPTSPEGLRFLVLKAGARHQMYFIRHMGFEQAVLIGNAFSVEHFDGKLSTFNPIVGGHFAYYRKIVSRLRLGLKWNWNFVWPLHSQPSSIYAHTFDLGLQLKF